MRAASCAAVACAAACAVGPIVGLLALCACGWLVVVCMVVRALGAGKREVRCRAVRPSRRGVLTFGLQRSCKGEEERVAAGHAFLFTDF